MSCRIKETSEAKRADRILTYHDMGLNNAEIAKLVDCSRENVRQVLARCGLASHVCWEKTRMKDVDQSHAFDYSTSMALS